MWQLPTEKIPQLWSSGSLPPITYQWLLIVLALLVLTHILIKTLLSIHFKINTIHYDANITSFEYSPFYHLAIIILVLSQVDWNIFDLSIWLLTYVGVAIIRNALYSIKFQRDALLNNYTYDSKLIKILNNSKLLGATIFFGSLALFVGTHVLFLGINLKIINMLVFPFMMMTIDSFFLFLVSAVCEKDMLIFFNHNINQVLPTYKIELIEKVGSSSVRVWHYYNLIRFFLRTLIQRMGVLEYMWIFSILNSLLSACKILYTSTGKYRNYNKLMERFDRLFRKTTSAPNQDCPICLTELLNCKQLASCGHKFHYRCLLEWMQAKMRCPICRAPIEL